MFPDLRVVVRSQVAPWLFARTARPKATIALRLPMWGGYATMPAIRDLPFDARRSSRDPADVRRAFGFAADERLALLSFGGYGLRMKPERLTAIAGYRVLAPDTFDDQRVYAKGYRYEDLVRAVDVVVSKPGYGIISDVAATALLDMII